MYTLLNPLSEKGSVVRFILSSAFSDLQSTHGALWKYLAPSLGASPEGPAEMLSSPLSRQDPEAGTNVNERQLNAFRSSHRRRHC